MSGVGDFLDKVGWEHKESGGRINLRTCPDCGVCMWHSTLPVSSMSKTRIFTATRW